ncbi:uncharacterized protein LOC117330080 [Pecten maximus]|uniref:uncharacterized protein LOC117330080 n=1 Tax=Pecten maximus TaxID=6579 RepID=UPI0014580CFF|nr:uncharacterized protein LOC117330080 [Pecten maximus]
MASRQQSDIDKLEKHLMGKPNNFLSRGEVESVWTNLKERIRHTNGNVGSAFADLENAVELQFKKSFLEKRKKKYSTLKKSIIAACSENKSTEEARGKQLTQAQETSPAALSNLSDNQENKTPSRQSRGPFGEQETHPKPSTSGYGFSPRNDKQPSGDVRKCEGIIQTLQDKLDQQRTENEINRQELKDEIKILKQEKDQLMTRLSKMAGDKLTHNNPGIADLSDPNRPQKLAEKYGELYDNEWTDAIEKLNSKTDDKEQRRCIDVLADILEFCYRESERVAESQLTQLQNDCFTLPPTGKQKGVIQDAPDSARRHLLEAQYSASRFTMKAAVDIVTKSLHKQRKSKGTAKKIPRFTAKCIEICWSMVTNQPRMVFLWPDKKKTSKIDTSMFDLYTRSGDILDFVVWPAMLSCMDGPLLRKGTVQPVAKQAT